MMEILDNLVHASMAIFLIVMLLAYSVGIVVLAYRLLAEL